MAKRVKKKIKQSTNSASSEQHAVNEDTKVFESPEVLQEQIGRSQAFLEENKNTVTAMVIGLVVVLALVFGYNQYKAGQEEEAQTELAPAIFYFEKDSLGKALNGDGNATAGLLGVASTYSSTDAGNLANFYAGAAYLKQGEFDKAISYLSEFSGSDALVQARAYSLLGDAYMEKGDKASAIDYYNRAVNHKPNGQFTPAYMMKLGLAYEMNGEGGSAKGVYERMLKEYPQSREANNAKRALAKF